VAKFDKPKYLLPCSCGRQVLIETTQAGERIRCECGAELEVPTLLEIARLERKAEGTVSTEQGNWGGRQRMLFVGFLPWD
jgi:hypothetical protein